MLLLLWRFDADVHGVPAELSLPVLYAHHHVGLPLGLGVQRNLHRHAGLQRNKVVKKKMFLMTLFTTLDYIIFLQKKIEKKRKKPIIFVQISSEDSKNKNKLCCFKSGRNNSSRMPT